MSEFIRSRDEIKIKESLKQKLNRWWRQLKCDHYWYSSYANPWSIGLYFATCKKCGKSKNIKGFLIDEVKKICWD